MNILIVDDLHPILKEKFENKGHKITIYEGFDVDKFSSDLQNFQGLIIRSRFKINKQMLQKNQQLKFIGRAGAGLENIDVEFAESIGIKCFNSPEGNRDAVGEHAVGMLLALQNKLIWADAELRNGIWRRNENWGQEIKNQTIGIIGYGNMGSTFAKKLYGFECKIIAYDKYKTNFGNEFVEEVELNEIFNQADILSFHVPLSTETNKMFDENFIKNMKKPFVLINTARGQVVDTNALVNGLKSKKIKATALDVLEYEQHSFEKVFEKNIPEEMKYLIAQKNVILSPHIAGWTYQSYYKIANVLVEKILKSRF